MGSTSVIIPCYRYGPYLEQAVGSGLDDQEGVDVRVLVIDAASPTESAEVTRKIAARDPRVEVGCQGYRVYVHASYSESSSLAIMEAMAAGLPIVTSCVKALAELIDDPAEGRYWPIDDVGRATDLLVGLVEDESERRRAGAAARARFERDYDAAVVAPRLLRLLDESQSTAAGPVSRPEPDVQERAGCGGVQSRLRSTSNQHRSGHGR